MTGYGDVLTALPRGEAMPLTPEDVQNKEFTTVRLREGYDMQEVDDFLDEVQAELERTQRENEELRDKLAAVTRGGGVAALEPMTSRPTEAPKPPPSAAMPDPTLSTGPQAVGGQPSEAAAKVLALAQKTADQLVADAKEEADRLLSDAQQRADKIDAELKAKVGKIEAEARQRAEAMEQEAAQRRQEVFGALESEAAQLERRRDELRDFEREYRSRLKAYLQAELRKLETGAVDESPTPVAAAMGAPAEIAGNSNAGRAPAGEALADDLTASAARPSAQSDADSSHQNSGASQQPSDEGQPTQESNSVTGTGGSLRSVASLLEDEQR
jgi:DivIVA domain-containing protein